MKKVRLYVNDTKHEALVKKNKICEALKYYGYVETCVNEDIVIGLGGDGTLFRFLKDVNYNVSAKYIGVNCGTLGFLQDFDATDEYDFVLNIPNYTLQKLCFAKLEITLDEKTKTFYALNEFSIHNAKYKSFKTSVFVENEKLENFVGTGIVFSTPTGSTALNLSAGGCILHQSLEAIQMTPREAITNSKMHSLSKSICIPKEMNFSLKPISIQDEIAIDSDGEQIYRGRYDSIKISYSKKGIYLLKSPNSNFIKTVSEKLI